MKSLVTDDFRGCFAALPAEVRAHARRVYQMWRTNPAHPSLRFKPIRGHQGLYSVRVGLGWRALGHLEEDTITWFWIGSHADYDKLIE
jgi:hypothetical protein